jgi:hypothetical protein
MSSLGDRRARARMEVVGALWGTLVVEQRARMVNVSAGGVLIESPNPLRVQSTQSVRLMVANEVVSVDARVRHMREIHPETAERHYLIGLEFVSPSTSVVHSIESRGSTGPEALE